MELPRFFKYRREIQSCHGQLDSHEHDLMRPPLDSCTQRCGTGREMIVWGGNWHGPNYFNTGGKVQPKHEWLDSHQHHQRALDANRSHGSVDR